MKRMLRWGNGRRGALVSKKRDGTSPHHLAVAAQILSGMAVGRANDGMAAQYTTPSVLAHPQPPSNRAGRGQGLTMRPDRKSTRLNSSHLGISYAVFCLKKKNK